RQKERVSYSCDLSRSLHVFVAFFCFGDSAASVRYTLPYTTLFRSWWLILAVIATLMSVASPLKIWNNTRNEMNLERHQQLLLKARMDALSRQINPHFLFNTLNTVTALKRENAD